MAFRLFTEHRRYYAAETRDGNEHVVSFTLPALRDEWVRASENRRSLTAPEAYRLLLRRNNERKRTYYAAEIEDDGTTERMRVERFDTRAERDEWVRQAPQRRHALPATRAYTRYARTQQRTVPL